jgi:hypothetical protein
MIEIYVMSHVLIHTDLFSWFIIKGNFDSLVNLKQNIKSLTLKK